MATLRDWFSSVVVRDVRSFLRLSSWTKSLVVLCVLLSTVIVWGFRYPPGVDLPGHAHLFDILANYHHPVHGVSGFYDLQLLTPYLVTYLLGALLGKVGGGLFATKTLLFATALLTPYALLRWLRAVGAEAAFAFFGFALAFGYPFVWGFISFGASLPLAFLCFEAWARAPSGGFLRRAFVLSTLLVLLFFTHAITFALVAVCTGLLTLCQPRSGFFRRASSLAVAFVVSMAWYLGREAGGGLWPHEQPGPDRFLLLFGAELDPFASFWSALTGLVVAVTLAVTLRPVLSGKVDRLLPLALSGIGFFTIPGFLMNTAYVGQRFVVFLHAFAPVAFSSTLSGPTARWVPRVSGLLTASFLALCLVRVGGMNRELAGLSELSPRVPPGSNVRGGVPAPARRSEWFDGEQFVGAHGWVTAERHGMLHNDPGHYFQLPILQARDVPFPTHLRYVVSRDPGTREYLKYKKLRTKRLAKSGRWSLHEDEAAPPFDCSAGTILRYGQDYGELRVDRSASKRKLSVAGQRHERGLGTRARSLVQLSPNATGLLKGACGIDDADGAQGEAVCTILDHTERVLHQATVRPGQAAVPFSVPVREGENVYLKATTPRAVGKLADGQSTHVDWVDLAIAP
jgi:hypothetical protein